MVTLGNGFRKTDKGCLIHVAVAICWFVYFNPQFAAKCGSFFFPPLVRGNTILLKADFFSKMKPLEQI